jgi:tetratricopeptide (TPR) repeat protein
MRGLLCGWLVAALFAMWPVVAHAQAPVPEKSNKQAAKAYVDAGLQAQRSGDYDTAIILYEKAYELVPHPVLLFNLAQAHRLAGRLHKALALYRKYLDTEPHGAEAATARELVTELEAQQAAEDRKAARARRTDADPTPERAGGAAREEAHEDARRENARAADRADGDRAVEAGVPDGQAGDPRPAAAAEAHAEREGPPAHADHAGAASRVQLRVALGTSVARRQLSYEVRSGFTEIPPSITTTGVAARLEGEIYPFALRDPHGTLSGLGLALVYDKTFGVSLSRVGLAASVPVDQSHVALGARYRFQLGEVATFLVGLDYARRQYVLDRSGAGLLFDVPDVDWSALAPTIAARVSVATRVAIFASLDTWLVLDSGTITAPANYGKASLFGVDAAAGLELALGQRLRLHLQVEYNRIGVRFEGTGVMSNARDGEPFTQDVQSATDLSIGVAATLGLVY